jgi:CRP-like cAMP-binding protein
MRVAIMPEGYVPRDEVSDLLVSKTARHGTLTAADRAAIRGVRAKVSELSVGQDAVRQGDRPEVAVFLLDGMLARYHTLPTGDRQYLSLHLAGDLPDLQSLFLTTMDHSLGALNRVRLARLLHSDLRSLILKRPGVGFALWRVPLVDAAIFRQAITNNSAREPVARLAHLFCEVFHRSRAGIAPDRSCPLPMSQAQLGQILGLSSISIHRALTALRKEGSADLRKGRIEILDWRSLVRRAAFDPLYLHPEKDSVIAQRPFRGR